MVTDPSVEGALQAELTRCDCLRRQDFTSLKGLLHPDLVHVHTRGNQDTRDSYLWYIAEVIEIIDVERQSLAVKLFGHCAIMSSIQTISARQRGHSEIVPVTAQVLQVWLFDQGWQQVAFQATALGPLPPPIVR